MAIGLGAYGAHETHFRTFSVREPLTHCYISEPRQPGGCKLKTAPVRPVVAARPAEYVCSEDLFY
ncbi:hypothetical protein FQF69_27370 [Escherichia coli]|nr:hypothetical protein [Escherichia coli]